jgi:hypothetical protein
LAHRLSLGLMLHKCWRLAGIQKSHILLVQRHLSHEVLLCILELELLILVPLQILRHVDRLHKHIVVGVCIELWNARRCSPVRISASVVIVMPSTAMVSTTSTS